MSMVIAHNIPAMNASKNLKVGNQGLSKSLEKLSSGFRINVGADGPADLVISEKLRAQTSGLERAVRNTTESINILSIAEGALGEMNSILKKMKALAIHAANNGVTSPDQVAADQAEMDSGIQTLERIANTTKYSDQFLLNGSKDLTFNVSTEVTGTQNNRLMNTGLSSFNQIFKREGYQITLGFNGATDVNDDYAIGNAAMSRQAAKAYLEIDAFEGTKSQIDTDGRLTKGQSFILTGSQGSRQFRFSEKAHVSQIVSAIHNVAGSTGVDASLIFNRTQTINMSNKAIEDVDTVSMVKNEGCLAKMTVYDNYTYDADSKSWNVIAEKVEIASGGVIYGKNTDGNGDIYVKITATDPGSGKISYELYKDASLSKESIIGSGVSGEESTKRNNSDLTLKIDFAAGKYGDVFRISTGNIALSNSATAGNIKATGSGAKDFVMGNSTASGVRLGQNTSSDGKIYIKTVYSAGGCKAMVYAYNSELMRAQDMVAKTYSEIDMSLGKDYAIVLDSIWNDEKTENTGLGMTLTLKDGFSNVGKANQSYTTEMQFVNLGARIYTTEYGEDASIKVQQTEGGIFVDYEDAANYDSARLIGANDSYQVNGQDATVNVNGQQMKTNGLKLNLATPDIMANVTFNEGKTGTTTLAQVGYGEGSIFNKATSLTFSYGLNKSGAVIADNRSGKAYNAHYSALLNNACHDTNEKVTNFQGGMQLQQGEGAGDQERTVIALKSMSTSNLGRMEVTGQWNPKLAVIETKTLSIQDVMGGQVADLKSNPAIAMGIIDKAISDVSELRAQIGSVQANMLQTNENNLRVAIENLSKTESDIRDTDMASEMTEFTRQQIMSNAGVSMLGQANSQAQQVMGLLQ